MCKGGGEQSRRGIQLAKELWSRPLTLFWRFTGDYQSHDQLLYPVNSKIAMVLSRVREQENTHDEVSYYPVR